MKKILLFVSLFIGLTFFAQSAGAAEYLTRETIIVPQNTISDGSVFAAASTIKIAGQVAGDLYCAGETVEITGIVDGDVLCAAKTITAGGVVTGSVRVASQELTISGRVGRVVTAFGQKVNFTKNSQIAGETFAGGGDIVLAGHMDRDAAVLGEQLTVTGAILGHLTARADLATVSDAARIGKNFFYTGSKPAVIAKGARITGHVVYTQDKGTSETANKPEAVVRDTSSWAQGRLSGIFTFGGLGLLLVFLLPTWLTQARQLAKRIGKSLALGFFILTAGPIVFIILAVTIIGIPFAILGAALWAVLLIVSRVVIAPTVGQWVLAKFLPQHASSIIWQVVTGVIVLWLVFGLPIIGGVASLFCVVWGTGAIAILVLEHFRHK